MFPPLLPWIRLTRLPAVFTVPGDVWVGSALAGRDISWAQTLSVSLLYLYGMVLNDVVDAPRDQENKPKRPLPAGEISRTQALVFGLLLAGLACGLQPGSPPLLLLLMLITAYTFLKDRHLWLGAVLMASCRGCVLWMGAGAPLIVSSLVLPLSVWGGLILGITLLADREYRATSWVMPAAGTLTAIWFLAPFAALFLGEPRFLIFVPWALLALLALQNLRQIKSQGQMHPRNTGQWLSMLIPLQSAFLFAVAPLWQGIVILCLWPLLRWSIRKMQNA
ncbi:UbiA family prenyltransferase [Kiritimatiellaeota bacterium B1221]|nr:UbiA family prenyltransferase [Kiritimatiellaeota bacterium B1221]